MTHCPTHPSTALVCPACTGSKGGKQLTPRKLAALRKMTADRERNRKLAKKGKP